MAQRIGRRHLLAGAGTILGVGALGGCSTQSKSPLATGAAVLAPSPAPLPLRASPDRITRITVCTRPFRPQGPRIELERIGQKNVVHHYGHGGSGWSLSWGSAAVAVDKVLATGERDIGVIGCGAIGLTTALALQRAGARVTIYTKDLPPNVRSSLATGVWSPDSRICMEEHATPDFKTLWEGMCRQSFQAYQNLLGLDGNPVEWIDHYAISDQPGPRHHASPDGKPEFADLQHELAGDLLPKAVELAPGAHPFGNRYARKNATMMFNITAYSRLLLADFHGNGGRIEIVEFHTPADLAWLPQKTLVNCTGYAARALFGDTTLVPVRGQLARMIPQPGIDYGIYYNKVSFVPRRDGLVFQVVGDDDYYGFNDETTQPDRAEAERAVTTIAGLFTPA